jgi:glutamate-1-semialdehyde 2,1-aminomutase
VCRIGTPRPVVTAFEPRRPWPEESQPPSERPSDHFLSASNGEAAPASGGNVYVDYALGFGPLLNGHGPGPVIAGIQQQLERGLGFGACHQLEAELAEAICRTVPSAERCVISNTGSEAVHVAIRIAGRRLADAE